MGATAFLLSLLLVHGSGDFQYLVSIRDLGSAMELADSDSLMAVVHRAAGEDSAAAALFGRAFQAGPSPGLFARMWEALSDCADDSEGSVSRDFREMLAEWGGRLQWQPAHLLSLVETASQLGDSILADSLTDALLARYPLSKEAYQVIGWEFYDNLYPVWYDDSARTGVLMDFIDRRGEVSDVWRSTAYRYALSAVLGTADSVSWKELHRDWMASCPGDPQVFLTGAALLIDRDSAFSDALELADRGILLYGDNWIPEGMPEEEWALSGPAIEAGLQLRRLQALSGLGRDGEALAGLDSVLSRVRFSIDDCNTEASLHWLRGRILLNMGDTTAALSAFGRSAALGDVVDRWSGLSESEMEDILFPSRSPAGWARENLGYDGPVFADVTPLLGPDSLLRGSRVSWCDWNSDGYPDLFAGSSLFQNEGGTGFTDITGEAGLESCRGNGGVWGDIDRDGRPDLVTAGNPVQVFLSGDDRLWECTSQCGIDSTGASVEGVALLDWNADGWLDLYLASYESPDEMGSGTADLFYLGGEDGFRSAGDSLGMVPFLGQDLCGRGVSPCDFDRDGDLDIFVSNYRLQENLLWENIQGKAVNTALLRGVAGHDDDGWWGHTIGSAWADWDNDGDWDLFSANLAHPRYITFSDRSMLYLNEEGFFTDVRELSGIRFEETHSNPVWGDFNSDGLQDLYITSVYPDRRSFLYLNNGDGTFRDVTWLSGSREMNGWGAAAADYNLDGRLDLAVGTGEGPVLLTNVSPPGNWALVRVTPPRGCNPSCIGCTVVLEQDGFIIMRQVDGGSGTTSQNSGLLHFGLPTGSRFSMKLFAPGGSEPVSETSSSPGSLSVLE